MWQAWESWLPELSKHVLLLWAFADVDGSRLRVYLLMSTVEILFLVFTSLWVADVDSFFFIENLMRIVNILQLSSTCSLEIGLLQGSDTTPGHMT